MSDQFYFDSDVQDMILACVAAHSDEFAVVGPLIQPEFMWGMNAVRTVIGLQDYHAKYGKYPSLIALDGFLQQSMGRDKADLYGEVHEYIQKLKKIDTTDYKLSRDLTGKFCQERALIGAVRTSADLIKQGKIPEGGLAAMFDEAMRVGQDVRDIGVSFYDDMEKIVHKLTDKQYGVKTGYHELDLIWKNGWNPGWLIVPLAPPKSYKSTFCTNLALNMIRRNTNTEPVPVFYYACEISAELTCARGYSIVSSIGMDKMYDDPEGFIAATRSELGKHYGDTKGHYGNLLLKGYPAKSASIADIRSHAIMAREAFGIKPKVLVIDHAETIKPNKRVKEASDHRQQSDIYTEARALGEELQCVVIMPDRCNKDTVQLDVPNMSSFQGAFEKAGVVDVAIGLCQTDEERIKNIIRYFIFVNRHGKFGGYFEGKVAGDHFKMTVERELQYESAVEQAKERAKDKPKRGMRKLDAISVFPKIDEDDK